MLGERLKEIADFAKTESPYRSANKGWITKDIFLQWGSSKEDPLTEFDQLAKVSFYWKPIFQILFIFSLSIVVALFVAFTPRFLSGSNFPSIQEKISIKPDNSKVKSRKINSVQLQPLAQQEKTLIEEEPVSNLSINEKTIKVEEVVKSSSIKQINEEKILTYQKSITATDLIQRGTKK